MSDSIIDPFDFMDNLENDFKNAIEAAYKEGFRAGVGMYDGLPDKDMQEEAWKDSQSKQALFINSERCKIMNEEDNADI